MPIRQPIVCVLGHIDSGKTSLLDKIRKSSVGAREAGGITQHIGASYFPVATLKELTGQLLIQLKVRVRIPGLLIIDTPGHEAFANLRRRGGAVSDIAILVVDILRGFEAQTHECVDILNVEPVFNNGRAQKHIELPIEEVTHDSRQRRRAHLTMSNRYSDTR